MNPTLRRLRVAFVAVAVLALVGVMAGMTSAEEVAPAQTAPEQMSCSWTQFGSTQGRYHAASAMTSMTNTMWIYGGLDQGGSANNSLFSIDFTQAGIANAKFGTKNVGTAQQRYGAAGAYRAAENEVFYFGGADEDGEADNSVQMWDPAAQSWNANYPVQGAFQDRVFAAAAYSPDHDAIVIVGGAATCKAVDVDLDPEPPAEADECTSANVPVVAVTWNDQGQASVSSMSGGPRNTLGGTLVYDSAGKRMLYFGGTNDAASNPTNNVQVLNLSDPDFSKASWGSLSTAGTKPNARFFHSAAYDASRNWMIVYGGVRSNAFASNESTTEDTWALDLGQTPPMWMDLSASENAGSVGSVMEYDSVNMVAVKHGGRRRGGGTNPNVTGNGYYLNCQTIVPTDTPTTMPTTPGTPPTTVTPGGPTVQPPTVTPVTPTDAKQCDFIDGRVPQAVINFALTNKDQIGGWGELCYPNRPQSPFNGFREYLTLRSIAKPYHPLYNNVIFKCGCP